MTIDVLDPTGLALVSEGTRSAALAARLGHLEGVTIGFLDNLKPGGSHLLRALQTEVEAKLRVPTIYIEKTGPSGSSGAMEAGEKMAEQVGAVINALGD
jgi:hypothetical protein